MEENQLHNLHDENSMLALTRSAGLIFSGTVVKFGESTVPILPPRAEFVVVRVDRGLRVDPLLGDLRGKLITVDPARKGELKLEQRAIFFTRSWIHGGGIAVREVTHLALEAEDQVTRAVEQIPEARVTDRIAAAVFVVLAEVVRIEQLPRMTLLRDDALWAAAHLKIEEVLVGEARAELIVHFPTSVGPPWFDAPRFSVGQRGIFILHLPSSDKPSEKALEPGSLVALNPNDFQPEERLPLVSRALSRIASKGGRQ